ncbi:Glycoside hydrolase [Macleaya cordata]|uniref:Glycoside hydrolase n=1 Tax=Macleaya cordata TaxID=56857 RepID=A0A200QPQ4_MACCD|nr:Glycoside hydrolase [Macleaya cordata]
MEGLGRSISRSMSRSNWGMEDVFVRSSMSRRHGQINDDEEALRWAALEKLPTYDRLRTSILQSFVDNENNNQQQSTNRLMHKEVDVRSLDVSDRQAFIEKILRVAEEDNEKFLRRFRNRIDKVGIRLPTVEVRFEHLKVEADCHVGSRALPTLLNTARNLTESALDTVGIRLTKRTKLTILKDASGMIKPSRMTLLLGPPSSGKTTLLLALAGKLDPNLKVKGEVTYNGHRLNEFVPQKTSAYISQNDVHIGVMTVKETLDFSARCQGVGSRYELLTELARREKDAGIFPEAEVDLFMKATAVEGVESSLITDYTLKLLGLDICRDTIVGDEMIRGISGGQKKRVTTGEMIVGPPKTLFMDEISTGLDSSTTFQIVKCLQQIVHLTEATILMSLLQPAPETFDLFDDIILLSEGQIVYQGPREHVVEFFESCGFRCPERKGTADFLQEVTSRKDQEQYWVDKTKPYRFISVSEFANRFKRFHVGLRLENELSIPYDKRDSHNAALVFSKYSVPTRELLKANFAREWLLLQRNSFLYVFKTVQIIIMAVITSTVFLRTRMKTRNEEDAALFIGALIYAMITNMFNGFAELSLIITRLPVFYKHRDILLYPTWTYTLPDFLLKIPISILESLVWMIMTYFTIGFAPEASRFFKQFLLIFLIQQMAAGLFKLTAAVCRSMMIANTGGALSLLLVFLLGGFILPQDKIPKWWIWGHWLSPLSYGAKALSVNEMFAPRWMDKLASDGVTKLGIKVLENFSFYTVSYWYWIGAAALLGFTVLFNVLFTFALMYLNPIGKPQAVINEETANEMEITQEETKDSPRLKTTRSKIDVVPRSLVAADGNNTRELALQRMSSRMKSHGPGSRNSDTALEAANGVAPKRGMVLPFTPLAMSFDEVNYFVDMPPEMKAQGVPEDRLQLLRGVTGAFRPGVLTALMGVSGAGKTTLMDVLAGRKTGGYIEGDIRISGFPKNQETFARISGYCEQNDIHSPQVTVRESLIYSAFLRLDKEVSKEDKMIFVDEVMELVELDNLKDAIVGLPGVSGLSTEQRKRLTIAVELVANPSIIFMDEPTSGLDARAAAIVMRTVRNTVDTGRTVVCTIHQPSIDIFEAFDELLLMKRGGQVIYYGPLGKHSNKIIEYFEAVPGVPKIKEKYNPATWMLEASSNAAEIRLGIDFAEHYKSSALYQRNKELVKQLSTPPSGAKDLYFPTKYSQPTLGQFKSCLWKQWWTYWRSPDYNLVRYFFTLAAALMIGTIFWQVGTKRESSTDLNVIVGAMYAAVLFVGINNCSTVQPIVAIERTVFYRERAAGMYSALPYAIAQVVTEIPYVLVQTTYYTLIVYAMVSFQWTVVKFFWFFFITFFSFLYFTYYGMMTVSITPNHQVAAIFAAAFYSLFNLFSGFFIPRPKIPKWWVWYYWICPVAWTVYGLILSQYGDVDDMITIPGQQSQPIKVEGAAHEDGRGLSIWDTFCSIPGKIVGGGTGDVAADVYHRYKEDVQILKSLGTNLYRFSISWPRLFPGGSTRHGEVNPKAIQYYNSLINELIENGIEPMVTIFHWDVPQVLEDEYGGFRSKRILDDYSEFAEFCFKEFGDRVKKWVTVNEPSIFATHGYQNGINAPGRCSPEFGNCTAGDSSREPYIVAHNLLLAHTCAVKIYRSKYAEKQKGSIGISLHSDWYMPYSTSRLDIDAAQRVMDNTLGLYLDPIMFGDYPLSVKRLVGDRLPVFSKQESTDIKGSFDFIGMNHYVTLYVMDNSTYVPPSQSDDPTPDSPEVPDTFAITTSAKDGIEIGPSEGGVSYWRSYPRGIKLLLDYIKTKYRNPPVYITEIGYVSLDDGRPVENILNDTDRIQFIKDILTYTLEAMREGADVRGFLLWSYIDNFEWDSGYPFRLGLYYVNYTDNDMRRIPKASAFWFRDAMNPKLLLKKKKKTSSSPLRLFGRLPYLSSSSS